MLDVKELFHPKRQHQLRAEPDEAIVELAPLPLSWRRFPDPAKAAKVQSACDATVRKLGRCASSLQLCSREARSSRQLLRQLRRQLEAHTACSHAVRQLLSAVALGGAAGSASRGCVGRARCFFCRELRGLEERSFVGSPEDHSSALADVSTTSSRSEEEVVRRLVRRRKTSRQRGRALYKRRQPLSARAALETTWLATHTVHMDSRSLPSRSHGPTPTLSRESSANRAQQAASWGQVRPIASAELRPAKTVQESPEPTRPKAPKAPQVMTPPRNAGADAAELEPYTSAAARFRAEMEFLDMSSFPGSPEVNVGRDRSEQWGQCWSSQEKPALRPSPILVDVADPPDAPPPSANSRLQLGEIHVRWKRLVWRLRRPELRGAFLLALVQRWASLRRRRAIAVHQPMPRPAVQHPNHGISAWPGLGRAWPPSEHLARMARWQCASFFLVAAILFRHMNRGH
ncbi:unnamed protein product [Effrenium voratum]|nr:unnamed protein product [Effrenium voratum]